LHGGTEVLEVWRSVCMEVQRPEGFEMRMHGRSEVLRSGDVFAWKRRGLEVSRRICMDVQRDEGLETCIHGGAEVRRRVDMEA